jgi:transglutaminase-like putative cysteine protease
MITFHISYQSENQYDHFVQEALFEFLVMPCTNETQKIIWENAQNSADSSPFYSRNVFGYNSLCFRVARPFNQLNFRFDCKVHKDVAGYIPDSRDCLPLDAEIRELESEAFQVDYILYTRQTTLTDVPLHLIPASMRYRRNISLLQYVTELNEAVHRLIVYTPNITTVNTKATDVLVSPAGVCQDYSHLMIGILRSQLIPARYVSGYLNQGQQLIGSARMHAWIEVYIPRLGWVGFDPTNNLFADYHYIKVADGQDYDDCSPLKGYIKPSGINCTDHSVQVVEQ